MRTSQRVFKNFLSLGFAEVVTRVLSTILTIYIARSLGANVFGQLAFATAFTSYFALFSDFGLTTLGIREIAKDRSKTNYLATNITVLQIGLAVLLTTLMGVLLIFIPLNINLKLLTFLFGLSMIPNALSLGYVFEAHERMEFTAVSRIAIQVITLIIAFVFIYLTKNILVVPFAQFLSGLIAVILVFILLRMHLSFSLTRIDLEKTKVLFYQAIPFVVATLSTNLYYTFDSVFIQFAKGSEAVGYYSAGYKIVLLLVSIARFFQAAIYPTLTSLLKSNPEKVNSLINQTSKLLIFLSVPLAVGGTVLARPIIDTIYGEAYQQSVLPFQVLIWSIFTIFVNVSFGTFLLASGHEKQYMKSTVVGSLLNIVFISLLIPTLGLFGAALATMVTEFYVLASFYYYTRKIIKVGVLKKIGQAFFAALLMAFVLIFLNLNIYFLIITGAGVYLVLIILLGFIEKSDILFLFSILKRTK
ncbi:MAG: flippase [Patescibacteria group bacterium]|nr:flippase [Patescibacteria group bacterium]